jgi:hypothetical protein
MLRWNITDETVNKLTPDYATEECWDIQRLNCLADRD